ncbi:MAG: hypothetical protein RQ732_01075 [Methylophaga sp.]|nr:hypothetical protein [Methylophaga sp.]
MTSSNKKSEIFYKICNCLLQTTYGVTIEDCGLSVSEWHQYYGDLTEEQAVGTFARKYDLQQRSLRLFANTKTRKDFV